MPIPALVFHGSIVASQSFHPHTHVDLLPSMPALLPIANRITMPSHSIFTTNIKLS